MVSPFRNVEQFSKKLRVHRFRGSQKWETLCDCGGDRLDRRSPTARTTESMERSVVVSCDYRFIDSVAYLVLADSRMRICLSRFPSHFSHFPRFPPLFPQNLVRFDKIWAVFAFLGPVFAFLGPVFAFLGPVLAFLGPVLALFGARFGTFRGPFWHFSGEILYGPGNREIWGNGPQKVPRQSRGGLPDGSRGAPKKCQNGVSQKKWEMRQTYGVSGGITFWRPFCLVVDQSGGQM